MNMFKLHQQLIQHEGLRLSAYQDSLGYWTIGVGRLIDARAGGGITEDEAIELLDNDIVAKQVDLDRELSWWWDLDEVRQMVLIDMCFNMGIRRLLTFKTTLALIKAGKYEQAAQAMLKSKWATQVKGRATRLAEMMRTGESDDI